MRQRLTLIGYRACGKSTLGRLVASRVGWPFADADAAVETALGMPIRTFWATNGEAAFRDAEAAALEQLLAGDQALVLATGGGAILRESNRTILTARGGQVVYLHAPAEVLQERLRRHGGGRPSLTGAGVADEVPAQLAVRDPLYRAVAGAVLDVTRPMDEVAAELGRLVTEAPA